MTSDVRRGNSHRTFTVSYKSMDGAENGKSCRGEVGLLLLLMFVEKKCDGRSLELERIWNEKSLDFWREYRKECWWREYRSRNTWQHDGGTVSGGCVSCF